MSWRVVMVSKPSKLDYSMGYIVIRNVGETVKVHLSEISVLIVENTASSITTALMKEMIDKKIKVIFCDEKRNPCSELTAYYGSHDCSRSLKKQLAWKGISKKRAWTVIVAEKIRNQSLVLKAFDFEQYKILENYINEIEFNDESNREGHAAKVYFNALFGKMFSRNDDCPTNAALNYGYSLILSVFNREVVCNGYITQCGLFHDNVFNQYNLSCDLMEPFRTIVDHSVKKMNPEKFEREEKINILNILNLEMKIDGKTNTMLNAVKIYSKSVFDALEQDDMSLLRLPIINYEL